jgi:hypothetical protein
MSQLIKLEDNLDVGYSDWHKCVYEIRKALLKLIGVEDSEFLYELVQMRFNILPYEIRNDLQTKIRVIKDTNENLHL